MASHSESNNARVERHFRKNPNRTLLLGHIAHATNLTRDQVRGAISYINAKAKAGNAIEVKVVKRGKQYRYDEPVEKPKVRKRAEMPNRVRGKDVPTDTPVEVVGMGTKDFNRMIDALGHNITEEERQHKATRNMLSGIANMHPVRVLQLEIIGETPEGYAIGKGEGGNVFKVVPV